VIKRAKGIGGEAVGHAHANPFFDTREYEVEFTDGTIERYATNVIAKNMSTMKVICFNCWMKSWIIRRMIQRLI
jgi:hypothetical protein